MTTKRAPGRSEQVAKVAALCGIALGFAGVGCGPKKQPPPPVTERVGAEERVLLVGKAWREMSQTEAFLHDAEVAWMRADDQFTLHLGKGGPTGTVEVERTELIRTPYGTEYHCKVAGAVQAAVRFEWRLEEATVTVRAPAVALQRRCKEPGFSRTSKQMPAVNVTYVLRGDRLVAIDPPTVRSALLPID